MLAVDHVQRTGGSAGSRAVGETCKATYTVDQRARRRGRKATFLRDTWIGFEQGPSRCNSNRT
jgi:hypothetical protein